MNNRIRAMQASSEDDRHHGTDAIINHFKSFSQPLKQEGYTHDILKVPFMKEQTLSLEAEKLSKMNL